MKPHPLALLIAALTVAAVVTVHTAERGARLDGPTVPKFSGNYAEDAQVLRDAQEQALELARALQEKSENPQMQTELAAAVAALEQSLKALDAAKASPDKLADATAAAKAAYQSLLKLAAREYQIQKKNQQSKGKGKGKQKQMQDMLDQLELKKDDDRYEKQSEAATQQNEEQREQLALLNRLKELAQRQEGVNEKLKELQTALQQAQTEEQKEEIRRQLKRLQEEQQQMLADLDEAKERMEQPQNQSKYADERQQLDKTREQAAKAAEALERESASEALAAGTRAQRELQDMSEEFRRKTSKQFSEEMRQMRNEARELAERQAEVGKQLDSMSGEQTKKRSLAEDDTRDQLMKQLEQQRAGLTNVLENMKRVSEQAEQAEPLLSRELYDTLRRTSQVDTQEDLVQMQRMLRFGMDRQAAPLEQKVRTEIDELRAGVERAARNVLGDEAESLRVARAELDQLSERLLSEMRQRAPEVAEQAQQQMDGRGDGQTNQLASAQSGESTDGKSSQPKAGSRSEQKKGGKGGEPGQRGEGQPKSAQKDAGQQPGEQPGEGQPGQQPGQREGQMAQGNQPGGQQPGEQPGQGSQGGQQPGQQPGDQPGQQAGAQRGGGQGSQPGQGGQQPGEDQPGAQTAQRGQPGQQGGNGQGDGVAIGGRRSLADGPLRNLGQRDVGGWLGEIGGGPTDFGPIQGEGYLDWSDRLRNVEEMLERPELRGDAARIREVVKGMRIEFKRHSKTPQWDVVESRVFGPLTELRRQVSEELARIEGKDPLVPIDRDPVPGKFGELVRRYYESLGSEK